MEKNGCGAMNKTLFIRSLFTILGLIFSLKLAFTLYISLDEFTYTHAAWLVSGGKIPYRDFPLFHPPLLELALSSLFFFTQSAFWAVLFSRALFGLMLFVTALLVQREAKSQIGFTLTLCLGVFSSWMTEIRPDGLALFLFLLANFFLSKKQHILSGILISLSLFSSEKALVYAPALIVPILLRYDLKSLLRVVLPAIISTLLLFGSLLYFATLNSVWEFLVSWAYRHETLYPRRDPWSDLLGYAPQLILLIGFAFVSLRRDLKFSAQWLALLILGSISYFLQCGPFGYSLLPAILALLILASKGLREVTESRLSPERQQLVLTFITLVFVFFAPTKEVQNQKQLNALSLIDEKVSKDSCVYDNSGFAVTREHATYWYFTDQLVRDTYMSRFEIDVPSEIQSKQCEAMVVDERFGRLSKVLQEELRKIFPNCQGLVCFR